MAELKYLIIHTTATSPSRSKTFGPDALVRLHTDPKPQGRGWRQVGYAKLIMTSGKVATFVENDGDGFVDSGEITNGALGYNSKSRHICYVGGLDHMLKPKDTLNPEQKISLDREIASVLNEKPSVIIIGHNQVGNKACPCFSVPKYLINALQSGSIPGLSIANIGLIDKYGHAQKMMLD